MQLSPLPSALCIFNSPSAPSRQVSANRRRRVLGASRCSDTLYSPPHSLTLRHESSRSAPWSCKRRDRLGHLLRDAHRTTATRCSSSCTSYQLVGQSIPLTCKALRALRSYLSGRVRRYRTTVQLQTRIHGADTPEAPYNGSTPPQPPSPRTPHPASTTLGTFRRFCANRPHLDRCVPCDSLPDPDRLTTVRRKL